MSDSDGHYSTVDIIVRHHYCCVDCLANQLVVGDLDCGCDDAMLEEAAAQYCERPEDLHVLWAQHIADAIREYADKP